jgi:hypothetical protein
MPVRKNVRMMIKKKRRQVNQRPMCSRMFIFSGARGEAEPEVE